MNQPILRTRILICLLSLFALCPLMARAQNDPQRVFDAPSVRRAIEYLKSIEPETVEEQIKLCEIPAPTFEEAKRGDYFKRRFTELGLKNVRVDGIGNVIGERPGNNAAAPVLVLAAHLDTVFPAGTPLKAKREGTKISLPGIGDDCRGLTVLLATIRAMNEARIETAGTIVFVANVGEEGLGDLRGVRHLFNGEMKGRATHFISVDGVGLDITNRAVGVVRYRVTYRGPGGHSYGAFGLPSPIHALGRAIEKISRFQVPQNPKTTFNVGRIDGGTSVNSVAHTAWMEVDLRSESKEELAKLDAELKRAVQQSLDEEHATWARFGRSAAKLTVEMKMVSERPAGYQAPDSPIVRIATAADKHLGIPSRLTSGSTDSNIPLSLGVPSITIDGGGDGRGAHSLDEFFDTTNSHVGTQRVLLIALGIVGIR
jgi:acetylornithine deacetylase/succinyl-diaminopimelate desuccinylase-like protein